MSIASGEQLPVPGRRTLSCGDGIPAACRFSGKRREFAFPDHAVAFIDPEQDVQLNGGSVHSGG